VGLQSFMLGWLRLTGLTSSSCQGKTLSKRLSAAERKRIPEAAKGSGQEVKLFCALGGRGETSLLPSFDFRLIHRCSPDLDSRFTRVHSFLRYT
jgi:hypothetical protein